MLCGTISSSTVQTAAASARTTTCAATTTTTTTTTITTATVSATSQQTNYQQHIHGTSNSCTLPRQLDSAKRSEPTKFWRSCGKKETRQDKGSSEMPVIVGTALLMVTSFASVLLFKNCPFIVVVIIMTMITMTTTNKGQFFK